MANYNSNYEIAQEISARLGTEPIPFDSVYSICLQIYRELGGTEDNFDSVYSILLEILPLVDGGVADKVIDDTIITTAKTWSSSKINSELNTKASIDYVDEQIEAVIGAGNSDIEGKETEDFTFVQTLPVEGEEGQQVIIKGDNTDTLYKYASGEWVEQTPDATKLYFDTENEVLYSYATAEHQFVRISMVNTIVVGSNLNTNADLKAIKTVGVYNVVQRLHNATKGDYVKNWTLYVESVDYEEYDRSDSVYQRLVSNYTIQKRTWSATRSTNDGWSNFSTYYAGEIKDSTTSKYYTWSSKKISDMLPTAIHTTATGVMDVTSDLPIANITDMDFSPLNAVVKAGKYDVIIDGTLSNGGMTVSMQFPAILEVSDLMNGGGFIKLLFIQCMGDTKLIGSMQQVGQPEESIEWNQSSLSHVKIDDSDTYHSGMVEKTYSSTKIKQLLAAKQGTLTAGANISISGGTISATDTTYVAGDGIEISGNTISCTVQPTPSLEAGQNIEIADNKINALGYKSSEFESGVQYANAYFGGGFSEGRDVPCEKMNFFHTVIPADALPVTIELTGDAGATSYSVNQSAWEGFISQFGSQLIGVYSFVTAKGTSGVITGIDNENTSIIFEHTISETESLNSEVVVGLSVTNHMYISGAASATTYNVTDELDAVRDLVEFIDTCVNRGVYPKIIVDGYGEVMIVAADGTNSTITLAETLDANNAVNNAELLELDRDYYYYENDATSFNTHAEGFGTTAGGEIYINPIIYNSSTLKLTTTQDLSSLVGNEGTLKLIKTDGSSLLTAIDGISYSDNVYVLEQQNNRLSSGDTFKYGILKYGQYSHAEGTFTKAYGKSSHAEGMYTKAYGGNSHVEGVQSRTNGIFSHAEGENTTTNNRDEHAEGSYNVSHKLIDYDWKVLDSMTSSGNTRHSIGVGYHLSGRPSVTVNKNAVEVMQNGDAYVLGVGGYQGTDTKVQDNTIKTLQEVVNSKADAYETATTAEIEAMFS